MAVPNEVAELTAGEDSNLKSNSNRLVGGEKRPLSDCTGRDLKMSSPRSASFSHSDTSSKLAVNRKERMMENELTEERYTML